MCRSICALVLLLAACAIHAALAPEPFFKIGWDKPVDPNRDCKFVYQGRSVTIELPGTDHDFAPKRKRFNAPRILRDVEGDFVMQVRVSGLFHPSDTSSVQGEDPSVAAGLLMIPAEDNCIRLEYGAYRRKGERRICPAFRMHGERILNAEMDWQVPWKPAPSAEKEPHIYLSLERQGRFIYEAFSPDGKRWIYYIRAELKDTPSKVKVGLAAYSTSTEPFKPRFDNFNLELGRIENNARKPGMTFATKK